MKSRLPKLTLGTTLVLSLLAAAVGSAQPLAEGTPNGQALVEQAAANLAAMPSLEAKMRQRVALFGQYLVGSGFYRQLIIGERKRLRLELRLQIAEKTSSLLQVSDGTALWEKRDIGDQRSMTYVNLRRVRQAVAEQGQRQPQLGWVAMGGIDFLLRGLAEAFQFQTPVPQQLGDLPVWEIRGEWKPEFVANEEGAGKGTPDAEQRPSQAVDQSATVDVTQLQSHQPHGVVLWLGRDEFLPLFPYRVEFRRTATRTDVSEEPIVTIELFEVQHCDVEPRYFELQLDDQQIDDRTDEFIQQLGL